jgi:hypothetical protein
MQSPIRFLESNSIRSNNGRLALLLSEINASAGTRIAKWQFAEASTTLTTPFFVGLASRSQGNGVVANTSGLNVFGSVFRQTITADTTGALLEAFNLQPTFVENGQTGVTTVGLTYNPTNPAATHYALRLASGMVGIGTLTPTQMLDVNGNARLRAHLFDYSNTSGSTGQVLRRGASGVEWQDENATAAWATITQASPDVIDAGGTEQAVQELALQDSKSFTMLTDSTLRFDIAGKYFITASFSAATDYLSGAYTQAFDATLDGSVVASSVLEYETSASGHQVSRSFYVNVTANQVMKFRIAAGTDAGSVERFNVIIQKVNR